MVVHCLAEDYDIYIGRGWDPKTGEEPEEYWGNPFRIGDRYTRETSIEAYRKYLWGRIRGGEITLEQLAALHGKTLGCWCNATWDPKACHGDVLEKAAAWAVGELEKRAETSQSA